jgi:hypothetical protein
MTMSSYWLPAPAIGLAAALAAVSPGSSLQAEPPEAQGAAAEKPIKLGLDLRITPAVSFAPSRIRAIAELRIPQERLAEFYCPAVEWDWGDLTESAESNECEPYEAGVSEVRRVFSAEHVFRSGGRYRVQLRLKRNNKVLVSSSTTVTVRPGVRDAPYDGPEP